MFKNKKVMAGIAATVMMVSACAVSASAKELTASLTTADRVKYSEIYEGKGGGELWGDNDSRSAGAVLVLAKQKYLGVWVQDCHLELEPGESDTIETRKFATNHPWQLGLNPVGALSYGCMADGKLTVF